MPIGKKTRRKAKKPPKPKGRKAMPKKKKTAKRRKATTKKTTSKRRKSGGIFSGKWGKVAAVGVGVLAVLAASTAVKQIVKPKPDEKVKGALSVVGAGVGLYMLAKVFKAPASVKTAALAGTGAILALDLFGKKTQEFGAEQGAKLTKDKAISATDPYLTGQIGYNPAASVLPTVGATIPVLGGVMAQPVYAPPPVPAVAAPIYLPEKSSEEIWAGVLGNVIQAGGQVAGSYMGMAGQQAAAQAAAMNMQSQMFGGAMGWGYDSALGSQGWDYDSAL